MPSLMFNSGKKDLQNGNIDLDSDTIKCMLTLGYTPNKRTHTKRSDVTGEISGSGYSSGGQALANKTVTQDNVDDESVFDADDVVFNPSTLSADGAVLYKSRGGASSADELICYIDLGGTINSTNGPFTIPWDAEGIINAM
jgi:hypothetical protein